MCLPQWTEAPGYASGWAGAAFPSGLGCHATSHARVYSHPRDLEFPTGTTLLGQVPTGRRPTPSALPDTQCNHNGGTGGNAQDTPTGHSRLTGLAYPTEHTLRVLTNTADCQGATTRTTDKSLSTRITLYVCVDFLTNRSAVHSQRRRIMRLQLSLHSGTCTTNGL